MKTLRRVAAAMAAIVALSPLPSAAALSDDIPAWLQNHVGMGPRQIAPVVLERARALYQRKLREGAVTNPCYFAKDATRPNSEGGAPGRRFYVICEGRQTFSAHSSGHGNGRNLARAKFRNGRQCATHFSNTEGSNLTAGGSYVTAEIRQSFKGYFSDGGRRQAFVRPFLIFDGEGETANARERDIGGHQAVFLRAKCRYLNPSSPHADDEGYVPYGALVNYSGGRSNGCTTWTPSASDRIISMVEGDPTTLYIYPESGDINAVANTVAARGSLSGTGIYWNRACLAEIGAPRFWAKERLQPIVNAWRASLPKGPARKLPICE